MYGFFLAILVLDGIFLGVVILLQQGKGGGLAAMGGGGGTAIDGAMGGRQASQFLVRATWTAGGAFMVLALILAIMSSRAAGPGSILQQEFQQAPTPVVPGEGFGEGAGGGAGSPDEGVIPDGP